MHERRLALEPYRSQSLLHITGSPLALFIDCCFQGNDTGTDSSIWVCIHLLLQGVSFLSCAILCVTCRVHVLWMVIWVMTCRVVYGYQIHTHLGRHRGVRLCQALNKACKLQCTN